MKKDIFPLPQFFSEAISLMNSEQPNLIEDLRVKNHPKVLQTNRKMKPCSQNHYTYANTTLYAKGVGKHLLKDGHGRIVLRWVSKSVVL